MMALDLIKFAKHQKVYTFTYLKGFCEIVQGTSIYKPIREVYPVRKREPNYYFPLLSLGIEPRPPAFMKIALDTRLCGSHVYNTFSYQESVSFIKIHNN